MRNPYRKPRDLVFKTVTACWIGPDDMANMEMPFFDACSLQDYKKFAMWLDDYIRWREWRETHKKERREND